MLKLPLKLTAKEANGLLHYIITHLPRLWVEPAVVLITAVVPRFLQERCPVDPKSKEVLQEALHLRISLVSL